jgi:acyl-CoA synthetase (AMP-forming)/AMP-acid ligase II
VEFNIAQVFAAVAAANPDRDCIVFGDRRFTFSQTDERARRFGRALHGWGLGVRRERSELASRNDPLPGAVRYEELLASVSDEPLDLALSPDDLYVLYTGGTTGMPKAVLWRQHDIYMNAMGGRNFGTGEMVTSLEEIVERTLPEGPGSMTAAPLMHGAAQWAAFISLLAGRPFVTPTTTHFDPAEAWALASRERVVSLSIVGDAFGRPLVDELESGDYDLSGLLVLVTGGAALSAPLKQ